MSDDGRSRERATDPRTLERLGADRALWHDDAEASGTSGEWSGAIASLREIVQTRLTRRQQEIVELYFYQGKSQAEIATQLGISQQVVSKQLFGVMRKGQKVGGAIRKLRRILEAQGFGGEREDE